MVVINGISGLELPAESADEKDSTIIERFIHAHPRPNACIRSFKTQDGTYIFDVTVDESEFRVEDVADVKDGAALLAWLHRALKQLKGQHRALNHYIDHTLNNRKETLHAIQQSLQYAIPENIKGYMSNPNAGSLAFLLNVPQEQMNIVRDLGVWSAVEDGEMWLGKLQQQDELKLNADLVASVCPTLHEIRMEWGFKLKACYDDLGRANQVIDGLGYVTAVQAAMESMSKDLTQRSDYLDKCARYSRLVQVQGNALQEREIERRKGEQQQWTETLRPYGADTYNLLLLETTTPKINVNVEIPQGDKSPLNSFEREVVLVSKVLDDANPPEIIMPTALEQCPDERVLRWIEALQQQQDQQAAVAVPPSPLPVPVPAAAVDVAVDVDKYKEEITMLQGIVEQQSSEAAKQASMTYRLKRTMLKLMKKCHSEIDGAEAMTTEELIHAIERAL